MIVKLNDIPITDNMTCSWDISKKYKDLALPDGFKLPDNIDLEAVVPSGSTIEIEREKNIEEYHKTIIEHIYKSYSPKPWWKIW